MPNIYLESRHLVLYHGWAGWAALSTIRFAIQAAGAVRAATFFLIKPLLAKYGAAKTDEKDPGAVHPEALKMVPQNTVRTEELEPKPRTRTSRQRLGIELRFPQASASSYDYDKRRCVCQSSEGLICLGPANLNA